MYRRFEVAVNRNSYGIIRITRFNSLSRCIVLGFSKNYIIFPTFWYKSFLQLILYAHLLKARASVGSYKYRTPIGFESPFRSLISILIYIRGAVGAFGALPRMYNIRNTLKYINFSPIFLSLNARKLTGNREKIDA